MASLGASVAQLAADVAEDDGHRAAVAAEQRLTKAAKKRIVARETQQFAAVVAHSAFAADPLGTIEAHVAAALGGRTRPIIKTAAAERAGATAAAARGAKRGRGASRGAGARRGGAGSGAGGASRGGSIGRHRPAAK